jgi:haloalkane dehalogenase
MHYIDEGSGDPILFLHGNPTSSYLWRNVIPHLQSHGRAIAVDLIGMGKSEKPDLDYRFVDHAKYVEGFINALKLANITLVIHDWGSGLGFDYAMRNPERIKGIAFMEAITRTMSWKDTNLMERFIFKRFRHPKKGPKMIMKNNFFVEKFLPMAIARKLSDEEKEHYKEPFIEEGDRKPVWVWPNEIPFDGQPADTHSIIQSYHEKLKSSPIPKLLLWAEPGMIIKGKKAAEEIKNTFANTETFFVGKGKHYLQEDHPRVIGKAIADWYTRISQKAHSTS